MFRTSAFAYFHLTYALHFENQREHYNICLLAMLFQWCVRVCARRQIKTSEQGEFVLDPRRIVHITCRISVVLRPALYIHLSQKYIPMQCANRSHKHQHSKHWPTSLAQLKLKVNIQQHTSKINRGQCCPNPYPKVGLNLNIALELCGVY